MPVTVIAVIRAKSGRENEVRKELTALLGPTRQETGCINYDLHQHSEAADCFMFHENWDTKKDLDRHLTTPHVAAFLGKADELLAEPVDIQLYERVE
jgi:quinol monooxygenase YgiN